MHYSTLESRMVEQCMQKIIGKNVYGTNKIALYVAQGRIMFD